MAGYQTIEMLRPILHPGPPKTPVVDAALVGRGTGVGCRPSSRRVKINDHWSIAPEVVDEMKRRRASGESYGDIARGLGTNKTTVIKYCRDVTVPGGAQLTCWQSKARRPRAWNIARAEKLRTWGFSYADIGVELGCAEWTAWKLLRGGKTTGRRHNPTSRMVPKVSQVTGFSCRQLRKGEFDRGGRSKVELGKARAILFWLLRNYVSGMSYPEIGGSLGGFDHTSCMYGVKRAQIVADVLGLTTATHAKTAARRLWEAEWPRASR